MTTLLYWMLGISGTIVGLAILIGLVILFSRTKVAVPILSGQEFKDYFGVLVGWTIFIVSLILVTGNSTFLWTREFLAILLASVAILYVLSIDTLWPNRWSRKISYMVMVVFLLVVVWQLSHKTFPEVIKSGPEEILKTAGAAGQKNKNVKFFEFDGKGELFIAELQSNEDIVVRRVAGVISPGFPEEESPLCGYSYRSLNFAKKNFEKGALRNMRLDLYPQVRPQAILAILRSENSDNIFLNWPCRSSDNSFVIKNPDGRSRKVYLKYNYQWPEGIDSKTVLLLALEEPR